MRPTLYFGRRHRWLRNTTGIICAMMLVLAFGSSAFAQKPQPHNKPGLDTRAKSPFNLQATATLRLSANLVACDILNDGRVCADPSGSGTTPGGFWPGGTANAYIFNSGLQLAGSGRSCQLASRCIYQRHGDLPPVADRSALRV